MSKFQFRATGAAFAFVAAVTLAGAAQAAPVTVKVGDINFATAEGAKTFAARVEVAAVKFCRQVGGASFPGQYNNCRAAVRVEMAEKLEARNALLAKRNSATTLAAADQ